MKIEVLGPGCKNCDSAFQNALKACLTAGLRVHVEKVPDIERIVAYGVLQTPALAVDGRVVASGRVPSVDEIREWIE